MLNVPEALTLEEPSNINDSGPIPLSASIVSAGTQRKYDIESDHEEILLSSALR